MNDLSSFKGRVDVTMNFTCERRKRPWNNNDKTTTPIPLGHIEIRSRIRYGLKQQTAVVSVDVAILLLHASKGDD